MKIREVDTTGADQRSAGIFFGALSQMWDLSQVDALDMFARNGQLTVKQYFHRVKTLDVWELAPEHRDDLRKFCPREIKIGCSYSTLSRCEKQYGLIVVDTPQGVHSDYAGVPRYEHFDVLARIGKIMADRCVVVLYVNKKPYDRKELGSHGYDSYDEYDFEEWMRVRHRFYETEPRQIYEEEALEAYRLRLVGQGFWVEQTLLVPCFSDVGGYDPYAFRLALSCRKL
jgi:hypothetical protein